MLAKKYKLLIRVNKIVSKCDQNLRLMQNVDMMCVSEWRVSSNRLVRSEMLTVSTRIRCKGTWYDICITLYVRLYHWWVLVCMQMEYCTSSLQWIMEALSQSSTVKSTKAHPTRKGTSACVTILTYILAQWFSTAGWQKNKIKDSV